MWIKLFRERKRMAAAIEFMMNHADFFKWLEFIRQQCPPPSARIADVHVTWRRNLFQFERLNRALNVINYDQLRTNSSRTLFETTTSQHHFASNILCHDTDCCVPNICLLLLRLRFEGRNENEWLENVFALRLYHYVGRFC